MEMRCLLHSIGGTVTQGGTPIGGIDVSVQHPNGAVQDHEAISMRDGSYRFDLLPPGSYTIQAKTMGSSSFGSSGPNERPILGRVGILLNDTDVLDANIDLRAQPNGKE